MPIEEVTDPTFEDKVLRSRIPAVVHFWAAWCDDCAPITHSLNELAPSYEGRLALLGMDVASWEKTPDRYRVRGIPTLMAFKDLGTGSNPPNGPVASKIKDFSKKQIDEFLKAVLESKAPYP